MKKSLEYLKKKSKDSWIQSLKNIALSNEFFPLNVLRDYYIIKEMEDDLYKGKDLNFIFHSLFEELQDADIGTYKFSQRQLFLFILHYCNFSIME